MVQAQANLASFIRRTDDARFQNELYRNVDFIVTDMLYKPLFLIEINDQTHLTAARRERDEKVSHICEEAGIPIIKLWTSYGVNPDYIRKRINETLASLPVQRIRHFGQRDEMPNMPYLTATPDYVSIQPAPPPVPRQKKGCYVATCVYGSYDCPQVWVLRRYRDEVLVLRWYGRVFIRLYYWLSPSFVKLFGRSGLLKRFLQKRLDRLIEKLTSCGVDDAPYTDMD